MREGRLGPQLGTRVAEVGKPVNATAVGHGAVFVFVDWQGVAEPVPRQMLSREWLAEKFRVSFISLPLFAC
jgi:hypothetical protein